MPHRLESLLRPRSIAVLGATERVGTVGRTTVQFAECLDFGKLADLVVLDQNLFAIPPANISSTRALVTLFEGKAVHGDLGEF